MPDFIIRLNAGALTPVNMTGHWYNDGGIRKIGGTLPGANYYTGRLVLSPFGGDSSWSLNFGANWLDFAGLPAGFTVTGITSAYLFALFRAKYANPINTGTPGLENKIEVKTIYDGQSSFHSFPAYSSGGTVETHFGTQLTPIDLNSLDLSALDVNNNNIEFEVTITDGFINTAIWVDLRNPVLYLAGTYEILSTTATLNHPAGGGPIRPGETFDVEDPAGGLDDVDHVDITYNDGSGPTTISIPFGDFISHTDTEITFEWPNIPGFLGNVTVSFIDGDGNPVIYFAGIPVVFGNPAGIYTLIRNKRNDTLYSDERDGSTYDVKIPRPFVKLPFLGSNNE